MNYRWYCKVAWSCSVVGVEKIVAPTKYQLDSKSTVIISNTSSQPNVPTKQKIYFVVS